MLPKIVMSPDMVNIVSYKRSITLCLESVVLYFQLDDETKKSVKYKQLNTIKNGLQCYPYLGKNNFVTMLLKLLLKIWTQPTNQV
jgi:hypothetical protein